jgi:NADH:ubiquinone oxidoreductase subunit 6 (subunit J)
MKKGDSTQKIIAKVLIVGLLLELMLYSVLSLEWGDIGDTVLKTVEIGTMLFKEYWVAVLMLGLMLFSVIIGGVFIAQEDDE